MAPSIGMSIQYSVLQNIQLSEWTFGGKENSGMAQKVNLQDLEVGDDPLQYSSSASTFATVLPFFYMPSHRRKRFFSLRFSSMKYENENEIWI